ncbi:MAG: hypothetical protein JNL82_33140, partial [Myxococcales bacterium]|nr:hypothetical protein [Myxococcales bacterium]
MSAIILATFTSFAFTAPATIAAPTPPPTHTQPGCQSCGGFLGIELGGGDDDENGGGIDIDLGDCLGVDIEAGASCGVVAGLDFWAECNPLAVEAACVAELGEDCGVEAFAACTAELVAHCQAELEAGGALFCDGMFVGADVCIDGIDVDVDVDLEGDSCVDGEEVDLDLDLDLDVCLDLDLDLNLDCEVEVDAECHASCDPIAVEAKCYAELGHDCSLEAFAACQAEVMAQCHADCD